VSNAEAITVFGGLAVAYCPVLGLILGWRFFKAMAF
jgi:hypothetical protein